MVVLLCPKLLTMEANLIELTKFLHQFLAFIKIAHEFIIILFTYLTLSFLSFILKFNFNLWLFVFLHVFVFFLTFYALIVLFLRFLFRCLLSLKFILTHEVFFDGVWTFRTRGNICRYRDFHFHCRNYNNLAKFLTLLFKVLRFIIFSFFKVNLFHFRILIKMKVFYHILTFLHLLIDQFSLNVPFNAHFACILTINLVLNESHFQTFLNYCFNARNVLAFFLCLNSLKHLRFIHLGIRLNSILLSWPQNCQNFYASSLDLFHKVKLLYSKHHILILSLWGLIQAKWYQYH